MTYCQSLVKVQDDTWVCHQLACSFTAKIQSECLAFRVVSNRPDLLSSLLLLLIVIVDATAVLSTPVTTLLVEGGGVNMLEKAVQQLGEVCLLWIIIHLQQSMAAVGPEVRTKLGKHCNSHQLARPTACVMLLTAW